MSWSRPFISYFVLAFLMLLALTGCKPKDDAPPFPPTRYLHPDYSYLQLTPPVGSSNYSDFLEEMARYPLARPLEEEFLGGILDIMADMDMRWDEGDELWRGQQKFEWENNPRKVIAECWEENGSFVWMLNIYTILSISAGERLYYTASYRILTDYQSEGSPFFLELMRIGDQSTTSSEYPLLRTQSDGSTVTYTIQEIGGPWSDKYVYREAPTTSAFDRSVAISNQGDSVSVQWRHTTKEGGFFVTTPTGDSLYQCWNTNLEDITCP